MLPAPQSAAASAGDGRLVLHNEAAGDIGVVARVPNSGAMPNGEMAAIVQAEVRARIVARHPSERGSDHVDVDARRRRSTHASCRVGHTRVARRARGDRQAARQPASSGDPPHHRRARPAWPTPSRHGARPISISRSPSCSALDLDERVDLVSDVGEGSPRRAAGDRADPRRRHRRCRQAAARVPAAPAVGGDSQGAR